ncbi:MAG: aminotransferase class V-fold PLP-dependent enzyme [Cyclobacteriaceae bacterium]|nr:aminotransferase class V-fold PLP-dependent enzyme [Cyclobacteriaceae bacterium]
MLTQIPENRTIPIDLTQDEFKKLGHQLIDRISELLYGIAEHPVTSGESPEKIQELLETGRNLPEEGMDPEALLNHACQLLFNHSLFNGHPKFWGYVTSSAAPLGILGDLLASGVNANVGAYALSPMATEMERQTITWIGEFLGYPAGGGLMVSGGNMANYVGFMASIRAKTGLDIRKEGLKNYPRTLVCYCSEQTHTWVHKAADLFGLGTEQIRWIPTLPDFSMDTKSLEMKISEDIKSDFLPFLVIGTAGTVSLGVVDPLEQISEICRKNQLWFHIDGAYGGLAAAVPEFEPGIELINRADSIAVDPHKWLYAPLEAGCVLVKDPAKLSDTFSYHPVYYNFDNAEVNYVDYGFQNSRGFRALKVWLTLQQMGKKGYRQLIREDILLARAAYELLSGTEEIEVFTWHLSITTFRYVPENLPGGLDESGKLEYLNLLNKELLDAIQAGGEFFVSHAMIGEIFVLRLCIVNFRTTIKDIKALPGFIVNKGKELNSALQFEGRIGP